MEKKSQEILFLCGLLAHTKFRGQIVHGKLRSLLAIDGHSAFKNSLFHCNTLLCKTKNKETKSLTPRFLYSTISETHIVVVSFHKWTRVNLCNIIEALLLLDKYGHSDGCNPLPIPA